MTNNLSRRSIAAGVALAPLAAVQAPAKTSDVPGADAELLQLGAKLLRVHRAMDELEAAAKSTDEDWAPILAEQAALVPQILGLTASTREGVAMQAVAAIRACRDLWDFDEAGVDSLPLDVERPFLEAMARYGGIPLPKKIFHRGAVAKSAGHRTGQPA
jgi:hypothetical protein